MLFKMIAKNIRVNMFVGIHDFEHLEKQPVIVNVTAYGHPDFPPKDINDCLDYSTVVNFVHSWENKQHTKLIETLLYELIEFCFSDSRISNLEVEIIKPSVIENATEIGVGITTDRFDFFNLPK